MHLLILGATGKTGVFSYKYALERGMYIRLLDVRLQRGEQWFHVPPLLALTVPAGYHVTILVRNTSAITPHEKLTVVEGSVLLEKDMRRAFSASGLPVDSVLQCLNPVRANDWNPWATFHGPARLLADATALAARVLREQQPQPTEHKPRLIAMNALGAGESRKVSPLITKFIIDYSNVGKTYEDHNAVDKEIEGNCGEDVLWTIVLAAALTQEGRKPVRTFAPTQHGASFSITRESCARWMVDVATGKMADEFSNKRVIVSN